MDEEFEMVYHDLLFPTQHYEQDLLYITENHPVEVKEMVRMFLPLLEEPTFTNWYAFLYKQVPRRNVTSREAKTRRIIVRRMYREANRSIKLMRTLDLILETIRKESF